MFDFDTIHNRRGTCSLKWNGREGEIPMWVADMDFVAAPAVLQALQERVRHGIFGYNVLPQTYYESIIAWWAQYHKYNIKKEWIVFCNGIVPAIATIIRHCTSKGAKILLQTPVYHAFFRCVEANGREVLESPLCYENGTYSIDFAALERDLQQPDVQMMILCNPHNPIGKVWNRDELTTIGELCAKHDVLLLSDEIHCDLLESGQTHTPMALVQSAPIITTLSASKAFNLAGLQGAFCVVEDSPLRAQVSAAFAVDEINAPCAFSIDATIAAFAQSRDWLMALNAYISANKRIVRQALAPLPVRVVGGEATYMLWIETSKVAPDSGKLCADLREHAGLYFSPGTQFRGNGRDFLRANLALPQALLREALERFAGAIVKL